MNIQASTVRRWTEEDRGILRDRRGRYTNKNKKIETKVVNKSTWDTALVTIALSLFLIFIQFVAIMNLLDVCIIAQ